jgi:hypothetical protein
MAMVQHDASAIEQIDVMGLLNTRSSAVQLGDIDMNAEFRTPTKKKKVFSR